MQFALSEQQEVIRSAIAKICKDFDDNYWQKKDRVGGFPQDFYVAFASSGWLGICIPEAYGGSGLGITEAAVMMRNCRIRRWNVGGFRSSHQYFWP